MPLDLDKYIEKVTEGELLEELAVKLICMKMKEYFSKQENVENVQAPITIVGDVHGQFYDLKEMFRVGGHIPDTNYLFLGDYIDRGAFSVETITYLFLHKLRYPSRVTLLRGNHETRQITQIYGFYTECQRKNGNPLVWQYITDVFNYLPIAAIVDRGIFCVHGGLSPSIQNIDDLKLLNRIQEIPHDGAFADIMWSDPEENMQGFNYSARGAGYMFGEDVVERFLQVNGMQQILRAHQLCMEGYQILFKGLFKTVWSAPNYCYRFENLASILELDDNLQEYFNVFREAPEGERKRDIVDLGADDSDRYFL